MRGRFTEFEGTVVFDHEHPEQSSTSLTIEASSVDSGTPDRDAHLRSDEFFAVGTHPTLTFTSSRVAKTGDGTYDVVGTLTIRGVAKEITMPVTYVGTAKDPWGKVRAGFETSFIAPRKRGRGGTEHVKPLNGIQLVQIQPGQRRSGQAGSESCSCAGRPAR